MEKFAQYTRALAKLAWLGMEEYCVCVNVCVNYCVHINLCGKNHKLASSPILYADYLLIIKTIMLSSQESFTLERMQKWF